MNYQRIQKDNFRLHLIETDKFKTIKIKINYKRKIKKEELTIRRLLTQILLESSYKYPNRMMIERETEDLYALSVGSNNVISGNYIVSSFSSTFLNEKYTEPGMNKRSLEFLFELIFNPDVKQDKFNEKSFLICKRMIEDDIKCFKDYPKSYSAFRLYEEMNKKSSIAYNKQGYLKDLKKINPNNLYDYYKDMINNDIVDIVIVGDIKKEEILNIIENYFSGHKKNMISESHFLPSIKIPKQIKIVKEKMPINQSCLLIGCTFDKLDDFEFRYVSNVYSFILGGSGDSLLFKSVREENSLCYHISSSYNAIANILVINAGIDSSNFDLAVSLIKEALEKMKKGEFSDDEIKKAKMLYKNSCKEIEDSQNSIINTYITKEYLGSDLIEEKLKKIDKVTKDMVISFANKIHIHTIFLLEGEQNGKEIS